MEIIYVSADTNEKSYRHDFVTRQGSWLAVPFKDPVASELRFVFASSKTMVHSTHFQVQIRHYQYAHPHRGQQRGRYHNAKRTRRTGGDRNQCYRDVDGVYPAIIIIKKNRVCFLSKWWMKFQEFSYSIIWIPLGLVGRTLVFPFFMVFVFELLQVCV